MKMQEKFEKGGRAGLTKAKIHVILGKITTKGGLLVSVLSVSVVRVS